MVERTGMAPRKRPEKLGGITGTDSKYVESLSRLGT